MRSNLSELERYQDVPVVFEAELDRRRMSIRELSALEVGKMVLLARAVGDDLPIYIGGALVGRGEAIRLTHNMGIRITALNAK